MDKKLETYLFLSNQFQKSHHNLYLVGGTVRDFLLGKKLTDMDAVTEATPDEVLSIIQGDDTFKKYGCIKVKCNDIKFDITTLRKETCYTDSRHPNKIQFVTSLEEDYKRRDFTINALYLDSNLKVIDFCDGQKDLNDKVIKMIGDPKIRLQEDPLRIVRALRFSLDLAFNLDDELISGIKVNIGELDKINSDKIVQDIRKIKCLDKNKVTNLFNKFGIAKYLNMIK